ncbi:MAG: COX15/CtaA family protein [Saprospiraceae bacterium]
MNRQVRIWLLVGVVMIIIQMVLGAITRLTGSGLSITRWDIVMGSLYPMSDASWDHYFSLYKETPQYQKINQGMSIDEFKFIFFWEFFHRLWARIMGFVFLFPFIYFLGKKYLNRKLVVNLLWVIIMAIIVASLGWIMVASGLVDRPWVNAYKLSFHLSVAMILLLLLIKTYIDYISIDVFIEKRILLFRRNMLWIIFVLSFFQFFLGGIMSGMKAALVAPTWPLINESLVPIYSINIFKMATYLSGTYEESSIAPLIIQFWHRTIAYCIFGLVLFFVIISYIRNLISKKESLFFLVLVSIQIVLGIFTLLYSVGKIPLLFGAMHQFVAILFVSSSFVFWYKYCVLKQVEE